MCLAVQALGKERGNEVNWIVELERVALYYQEEVY